MLIGTTSGFATTSWLWELQKLFQNAGEWIWLQINKVQVDLPDLPAWTLPDWWEKVVLWLILVALGIVLVLLAEQIWQWSQRSQWTWLRYYARRNITDLPSSVSLSAGEWFTQAQQYQQQHNFKEACRSLYMALLQRLQESQVLTALPSRTDQEYATQLQALQPTKGISALQPYQTLLITHEQLCFSDREISAQDFQHCYQAYQAILADTVPAQSV
jgi:hypothetical protein